MVCSHKTNWGKKLFFGSPYTCQNSKTTAGKSPYYLVYGQTTIWPIELEVEKLRVLTSHEAEKNPKHRLQMIDQLEEERTKALEQTQDVQAF